MATPTTEETSIGPGELRRRSELVLEMIALRHQIAVLKRSGTRRPCFGLWDRLFWILLSWRWPRWPESLMIIQPETVKRWRRNGWSGLWRYRSGGRWRGGRPRVSREVRELINRMARENFLWGAPRIHGAAHAWVQGFPGDRIPLFDETMLAALLPDNYSSERGSIVAFGSGSKTCARIPDRYSIRSLSAVLRLSDFGPTALFYPARYK